MKNCKKIFWFIKILIKLWLMQKHHVFDSIKYTDLLELMMKLDV